MKAKLLIVALVLLALATSGFAACTDPNFVAIIINVVQPLTDNCTGGTPLADGSAVVQVVRASNGSLADSLCGFLNFGYELPINGDLLGLGAGYFGFDPAFGNPTKSDPAVGYQCKVVGPCVSGFQAVWMSNVFYCLVGPQEIYLESWTCTMVPCGPSCDPTTEVWFPDGFGRHFESACVTLCEGSVCLIYTGPLPVCPQGDPALDRFPLYTITPGCEEPPQPHDPNMFCNDPTCPPALVWNFTDWEEDNHPPYQSAANVVFVNDGIHVAGYYYVFALAYAGAEGCVCVHFDEKLPVEMGNVDLAIVDDAVRMTWNTVSENDLDKFIVSRNGEMVGEVRATNTASGHEYSFADANVEYGTSYTYELAIVDLGGAREVVFTESITPSELAATVSEYKLHQNFPNPFNPSTSIRYDVKAENHVTLKVFNATGQEVATLVNGSEKVGVHFVNFDAANLTSGLYFYTIQIGDVYSATKKMLLVK
ncbi:T9SS type A sorting domain-containing protein [bacterium]|nr:T9SS type A sorting domain-containing protein [bacterium]MBU1984988.1 T9SS type A sorting domain-containing protein [bacterium]